MNKDIIRPQGRWLVRSVARSTGQTEAEVEAGLNQLIEHGHLKVLHGATRDEFQPLIRGEDTSDIRISSAEDLR